MSGRTLLIVLVVSLLITAALWYFSDGRIWFLGLPLVFGLPFLSRRRG
jgi:hypothetical protein